MSDRLEALRLFSRVARTGSFSAAGRELGLSQPSVSRIVADLEREVGAALLTRTTRAVTLTEAGSDYLARIEPILSALEEADHAARGTGELRGVLRVAVSSSFAVREVIPRLPAFLAPHPALRVDLLMNDQRQDLLGEGIDVALRFGALADSTAIARRLGTARAYWWPRPLILRKPVLRDRWRTSLPIRSSSDLPAWGTAGYSIRMGAPCRFVSRVASRLPPTKVQSLPQSPVSESCRRGFWVAARNSRAER
jgi:DNA-binding transcriptional LysR family regulator